MKKVYIVTRYYLERSEGSPNRPFVIETLEKVFDSENKAIGYICDRIIESYECADEYWPNDEHVVKIPVDTGMIREYVSVTGWYRDVDNLFVTEYFVYNSCDVE